MLFLRIYLFIYLIIFKAIIFNLFTLLEIFYASEISMCILLDFKYFLIVIFILEIYINLFIHFIVFSTGYLNFII